MTLSIDSFATAIETHLCQPNAKLADCADLFAEADLAHWTRQRLTDELEKDGRSSQEAFSVVLAQGSLWQLKVTQHSVNTKFLYTQPFEILIAPINGQLEIDEYQLTPNHTLPIGVGTGFTRTFRHAIEAGNTLLCGTDTIHDIQISHPILVAKLIGPIRESLQWMVDRPSLKVVQAISSSPVHSELEIMARALGAMRNGGTNALEKLVAHDIHFVRWAAIQAMGRISPARAMELLEKATTDEHPHIRQSAANFLSRTVGSKH
ncbi:HEAT repeat domain-containing protein [Xanthomonas sp. D-109]|uniref:HEAT repeat domain-containing protein n=1 Tax=Xanthomonas sp. D-109 TaxID=2821274 RepID=UPI001ADB28D3|nr:HEAT repeat domain-containing protein [Xanthomonas sp. D-109]MBO9880511.1 HEAT repeat domain-containing protein [Xanthomonas sp. D-109]